MHVGLNYYTKNLERVGDKGHGIFGNFFSPKNDGEQVVAVEKIKTKKKKKRK